MESMQELVLHFGRGEKGKFVALDLLRGLNLPSVFEEAIGNGLMIGGLNIGFPEKVIGLPEDTTELTFVAPGADPVTVPCVLDVPERTEEEEAEVQARRNPTPVEQSVEPQEAPQAPEVPVAEEATPETPVEDPATQE